MPETQKKGFTLIELFAFFLWVAAGIALGRAGYSRFGWAGAIAGAVVGAVGAILLLKGMYWIVIYMASPLTCPSGRCRHDDIEWSPGQANSFVGKCRCGHRLMIEDTILSQFMPDGSTKPYGRRRLLRGWKIDLPGAARGPEK
jgi:hypothetical protein